MQRIKFLQQNIIYPQIARENGYQGMCHLAFIVNADGSVDSVGVAKSTTIVTCPLKSPPCQFPCPLKSP